MGQLAEEIEAEHEPPAEPDFYHSLSFSAEALSLFSDETNNLQLQRVSMQFGGKVRSREFCSEKESSEHSFD